VQPGAHRVGCGGLAARPTQSVAFCPREEAAQLAERADQAVGVVGVELVVEGELSISSACPTRR
jgi:hypothetical protein